VWLVVAAVAALLTLMTAGWYFYSRRAATVAEIETVRDVRSIAVMPFVNESGNEEVEYLSDGMTETLINSLSEVPSLSVKSRPRYSDSKAAKWPRRRLPLS
jgi:TolB-like protein